MINTYEEAFHYFAPLMRARWHKGASEAAMKYAVDDILATLALHDRGPYAGKLYAELDAIRDAMRLKHQGRMRRRNPYC